MTCAKCGEPIPSDETPWPARDGVENLCHDCFEVEADEDWWTMARQLPEVEA